MKQGRSKAGFLLAAAVLGGISAIPAQAFQVADFKSGMSLQAVKDALTNWKFDQIQSFSNDTLIAYDQPDKGTYRQYTFSFCRDRLVGLEQELAPAFKNLVTAAENHNHRYGQPTIVDADNNVISLGETSRFALYWRNGAELVGIRLTLLPNQSQLVNVYEVPNACWQIPRRQ